MKAKETTLAEPVQMEILWKDATIHSLKIFTVIFITFARYKIVEVKVLKLSSSFYFADFDQLKSSLKQQIFAKI